MAAEPIFYFEDITNPTEFIIDTRYSYLDSDFFIRPRTEKGWTLDFIFNMSGQTMTTGNTFYYWGIKDEFNPTNYVDNNVSFDFTYDGRIRWRKSSYVDCAGEPTITEKSGKTPILCSGGTSSDFNVTIVFDRNLKFDNCCDFLNEGGENDLITGITISNSLDVLTGATPIETIYYTINNKWYKERYKRYGTLKIYLNGRPIYKLKNWEEIIPTIRQSLNPIVQVWGGGTLGSGGIHEGTSPFQIKRIAYYESPLTFIDIRNNYLTMRTLYDIVGCIEDDCNDYPLP